MFALAKMGLMAVPGANYALIAWDFLVRYWKPIAIAVALAYSFHSGIKHERKKHDTAQLDAQITKLTFERDNLKRASDDASATIGALDDEVKATRSKINELLSKPVTGDCDLSDAVRERLRNIGR